MYGFVRFVWFCTVLYISILAVTVWSGVHLEDSVFAIELMPPMNSQRKVCLSVAFAYHTLCFAPAITSAIAAGTLIPITIITTVVCFSCS